MLVSARVLYRKAQTRKESQSASSWHTNTKKNPKIDLLHETVMIGQLGIESGLLIVSEVVLERHLSQVFATLQSQLQ
jgi:hypothetical protein